MKLTGLHHVTAITGDSKENYAFYTKVLLMRCIKKTINHDDPSVYHLYYSDQKGSTGSLMTFFGYEGARRGTVGKGSAYKVQFSVPELQKYKGNFEKLGYTYTEDKTALELQDPDGLKIELIQKDVEDITITGIYAYSEDKKFYEFLTFDTYTLPDRFTFFMDNFQAPQSQGAGSIHHVALAIKNAEEQESYREMLVKKGIRVSPVIERVYFKSIYFPDTNGLLLEVATDGPGMFVDEENPGEKLVLPEWYEKYRKEIETNLSKLE